MQIDTHDTVSIQSDNHRLLQKAAGIFNGQTFGNTSFQQKFADMYRLQQRVSHGAVVVVVRSADIGREKSTKGTKSHPTTAFLLY